MACLTNRKLHSFFRRFRGKYLRGESTVFFFNLQAQTAWTELKFWGKYQDRENVYESVILIRRRTDMAVMNTRHWRSSGSERKWPWKLEGLYWGWGDKPRVYTFLIGSDLNRINSSCSITRPLRVDKEIKMSERVRTPLQVNTLKKKVYTFVNLPWT